METLDWDVVKNWTPRISATAHKYTRGVAGLYAGSEGAIGAACIAAVGAQAAGAGLVRLYVDRTIYPITATAIAAGHPGIMVSPCDNATAEVDTPRFHPDALLLGSGWGSGPERLPIFDKACAMEGKGTPLILDADALTLAKGHSFQANAILTPHTGEASRLLDVEAKTLLAGPQSFLLEAARKMNVVILYKAADMYIAGPDGRLGMVPGRTPVLAAGGSGDLLAGLCCAIAARSSRNGSYDPWKTACIAAALLHATALRAGKTFTDPSALASIAASLSGAAWL
jgi:NAD(P)H-hydrate epimerase